MSRRAPNPAAERAAQNQITIKNLLKLEPNKVCADCKKNKHPRWASWNLGVFICIRCSGIHRGMGTHISRVKSVDLDSWTDEQLQSILSWGNSRANKYWEAKLAPGHAPSEAKIENFIRTKYELKRWVMDGPMPDPSTLDADGDDDVPLSLVKEKQVIERKESLRRANSQTSSSAPRNTAPVGDLIGGDEPVPARSSTAGPRGGNVPPRAEPAPPKPTSTKDSLLGLDFLGESTAPPRPASTPGTNPQGGQSRPDLKQSILSLYASVPKPQPPQQTAQPHSQFGLPPSSPPAGHQRQGSGMGFGDAFSSLSISGAAPPKPAAADPFASFGSATASRPSQPQTSSFGGLSGGGFFSQKPQQPHQQKPSSDFDAFGSFTSSSPAPAISSQPKPAQPASSAMGDLFDLSAPSFQSTPSAPAPAPALAPTPASPPASSVFNLNKPAPPPPQPAAATTSSAFGSAGFSGADVWGSNEWASAEPKASPAPPVQSPPAQKPAADFGWGTTGSFATTPIVPGSGGGFNPAPKVTADEEFGGWASSTGAPATGSGKPAGAMGGDDDLFNNVWQ
ncbi:hypothetical protein B0I35DRAFT_436675 [Stachybotrys elegans]|uniref:Arf-GAP domain-containing protein n=1 Tax=Stachybotrys elegans TaxID=80388 RepID=A0A8K0SRQ9_9HYPO|nr:hypothetical protein B0I35DRAFT_436675 [Stachybotrys elegans]